MNTARGRRLQRGLTGAGAGIGAALLWSAPAGAQSLFARPAPPEAAAATPREQAQPLYPVSLFAVQPPKPPTFAPNDLITIVIQESTNVKREQTLQTDKEYDNRLTLLDQTALRQFLELRRALTGGGGGGQGERLARSQSEFQGDGEYERKDKFSARVTARVLEVKPNGTLLLEARTTVKTDEETQTIMLSGLCRTEDVRNDNTVLSSQIFDLKLDAQHTGQVSGAARKGWIARALEALFNF